MGGLFSAVKNDSKNFGNNKNIGLFRKIFFSDFLSLWPSLEWKTFFNGIKVNIYAYANKIVENNDFLNDL